MASYVLTETQIKGIRALARFAVKVTCIDEQGAHLRPFNELGGMEYRNRAGRTVALGGKEYKIRIWDKDEDQPNYIPPDNIKINPKIHFLTDKSLIRFHDFYKLLFLSGKLKYFNAEEVKENNDLFIEINKSFEKKITPVIEKRNLPVDKTKKTKGAFAEAFCFSNWYGYVRRDSKKEGRKIGRMVLRFKNINSKNQISITLEHYLENFGTWEGIAWINESEKTLVITLTKDGKGNDYTHFLLKADVKKKDLNMCIGHTTIRNTKYYNIVTKTIILSKGKKDVTLIPGTFNFGDADIETNIQTFFQDRQKNRLSSPRTTQVYNSGLFLEWMEKNNDNKKNFYKAINGYYKVFYRIKPFDKEFTKDHIQITSSSSQILMDYTHVIGGVTNIWKGHGYPNVEGKILSMCLEGPIQQNEGYPNKSDEFNELVFVMINLPHKYQTDIDTLTGLMSGNRDLDKGSVSRLVILVKVENEKYLCRNFNENTLKNFFNYFSDRSRVRPPISYQLPAISNFDHLDKAIEIEEIKKEEERKKKDEEKKE